MGNLALRPQVTPQVRSRHGTKGLRTGRAMGENARRRQLCKIYVPHTPHRHEYIRYKNTPVRYNFLKGALRAAAADQTGTQVRVDFRWVAL